MAQLKDSIITGDLRVTGTIYGTTSLNNLTDADDLKAIEALSGTSGILKKTAANTWTLDTTNYTSTSGTVTSVRVQATSPVVSSVNTAQSATLNTTISLADGYGDTKNPYGNKTARYVLAAPASAAGVPTFRALTNADVGLSNVENTKLSTWAGSGNITTIGTLSSGTVPWARLSNVPSANTSTAGIIQIGTGASNAAAGNHNHDSTYVSKGENPLHIDILEGTGIVGTDAGSGVSPRYTPGKWTFNSNKELQDGDIFVIKIPVAGTVGVWMSVDNGTTYHPITLHNTSRLTTQYPVGTCISVIYQSTGTVSTYALNGADSAATVTGVFRVLNYYDANTTYSAMSVTEIKAGTATTARTIRADYLKSAFTAASDGVFKTGSANGTISVYGTDIAVKGLGTAAYTATTDYATSGHTHTTSIAESNGTNQLTLAFGTKYAITAGETSYIFTTPANPNTDIAALQSIASANKWRKITLGSDYFNTMGEALIPNYSATGQLYVNSQLEFNTEAGTLKATEYSVNGNATLQYNSTTESLDFVF